MQQWFQLIRPAHWVKNVFVLIPLVFSGHLWSWKFFGLSAGAFACFCLISSSVYVFNDIKDSEADRNHPKKSSRPIASGLISLPKAWFLCIFLLFVSALASYLISKWFLLIILAYLANNIVYTLILKNKVVIDIISIAIGFVLRPVSGALAINVTISDWLLICVFCLALFLGTGKRRVELVQLAGVASQHRRVYRIYTASNLDPMLAASASMTTLAYMLYATSSQTLLKFGSNHLLYGTPFVVYTLFRYFIAVQEGKKSGPLEILMQDAGFIGAGFCWLLVAIWTVYHSYP